MKKSTGFTDRTWLALAPVLALALLPILEEVNTAIKSLSKKAPDAILAEVFSEGGPTLVDKLLEFFQAIWTEEEFPPEDPNITHLYENKGNRQSCDNHRGISVLAIAGKILARILLNRLQSHLENVSTEE